MTRHGARATANPIKRAATPLSFRERLAGPVAIGATTPRLGAERGRADGTRLVADLEITIDDIDDPRPHQVRGARLGGWIRVPGLTSGAAIVDGRVELYVVDAEVGMKQIRYDAPFSGDDGRSYRLCATTFIRPGRAMLREHATAYARVLDASATVHQIPTLTTDDDAAGPPTVAAGVLRLGLWQLGSLLWSVRAEGLTHREAVGRLLALARREVGAATAILAT